MAQAIAMGGMADHSGHLSRALNPIAARAARARLALIAGATQSPADIQQLAEALERPLTTAPELALTLQATLTAGGKTPTADVLAQPNQIPEAVQPGFRLKEGLA